MTATAEVTGHIASIERMQIRSECKGIAHWGLRSSKPCLSAWVRKSNKCGISPSTAEFIRRNLHRTMTSVCERQTGQSPLALVKHLGLSYSLFFSPVAFGRS